MDAVPTIEVPTIQKSMNADDFIIAPRVLCQSCHAPSGPTFVLSALRDTSSIIRDHTNLSLNDRATSVANVAYAQAEGALLDQEISHVQESLDKLTKRRAELRQFEEFEKGLFSPDRIILMDVLQDIFMLVYSQESFHSQSRKDFPRLLSQVCTYWRFVAQSCAPMWSSVICNPSIYELNDMYEYNPKYGQFLEDCLRYSGHTKLSICLSSPLTYEALGEDCMKVLARSGHRWKDMIITSGELANAVFTSIPTYLAFDHLEMLVLKNLMDTLTMPAASKLGHLVISECSAAGPSVRIIINSAPSLASLAHLTLKNVRFASEALSGADWALITRFETYNINYKQGEFSNILEQMPNLMFLSVSGFTNFTSSILLSGLEILEIGERRPGWNRNIYDARDTLDFLITPRLKKLHIYSFTVDVTTIIRFSSCSKCKLEELHIYRKDIREIDISLLAPELILPELQHLSLANVRGEERFCINLINMLKSRLKPQRARPLRSVRMSLSSLDSRQAEHLRNFVHSDFVVGSEVRMEIRAKSWGLLARTPPGHTYLWYSGEEKRATSFMQSAEEVMSGNAANWDGAS